LKLSLGNSIENPFVIKKDDLDHCKVSIKIDSKIDKSPIYASFSNIHALLDTVFGQNDGDYFVIGENNINVKNQKYLVYYIEDKDTVKHTVFFRIEE
jgi:hypothetical protein